MQLNCGAKSKFDGHFLGSRWSSRFQSPVWNSSRDKSGLLSRRCLCRLDLRRRLLDLRRLNSLFSVLVNCPSRCLAALFLISDILEILQGQKSIFKETKRDTALFHCTRGLTLNEGIDPQWDVQETLGSDQTERMEDRAWAATTVICTVYITLVYLMMIGCCSVVSHLARGC